MAGASGREGSEVMESTFWQCEQLRAGQVYNKVLFQSRDEAEDFVRKMRQVQPDIFWRMEAIAANAVWN